MTNQPALSIVIPVFNGAAAIGRLVEELSRLTVDGGHEIIVVNDGSADSTSATVAALAKTLPVPVTLIDLFRNFGEHNAVMAGLAHARGRHVVTMDADFQHAPADVKRLYDAARKDDFDVVYATFGKTHHPLWRRLGSRFANVTANLFLDKPPDLRLTTFRCLSAALVRAIVGYRGPYPFVDGLIFQATDKCGQVEVAHQPRAAGDSTYTLLGLIRLWLTIAVTFSPRPLRASAYLGFVMCAVGLAGVLWVFYGFFFLGDPPQGWPSLMLAVLLFSGVQLLILGVVGEYVGRILITVGGRPQYVVRDVRGAAADQPPPAA